MNRAGRTSRRTLLAGALTALTATAGVAGCSGDGDGPPGTSTRPRCVPRSALERVDELAGARLVYEETGRPTVFAVDAAFADRLRIWKRWWDTHGGRAPVDTMGCYGTWVDGGGACDSWHHSGRAFDLTRLQHRGGSRISLRRDRIGDDPAALRAYWRVAASLHLHFAYVLTYLFDEAHQNHIHVDNGRSGGGDPAFSTTSRVQVQAVQAVARHVWELPVAVTGRWNGETRRASADIVRRLGGSGDVATGREQWRRFLAGSVERG